MSAEQLAPTSQHTFELGRRLGRSLGAAGGVVWLTGALGSGKTVFAKGLFAAYGVDPARVTSPSFTIINRYGLEPPLHHVDLYRLGRPEEIVQAGIDAYFYGDGICLIEWAEKAGALLPTEHLYITLEHAGGDERRISLQARGGYHRALLRRLRTAMRLDTCVPSFSRSTQPPSLPAQHCTIRKWVRSLKLLGTRQ